MSDVTLALLQTAPAFGELEHNLGEVEQALEGLQADLLVLPELFASGYSFRDRAEALALAEPFDAGPTTDRLCAWSRQTGGMIVAGYPERDGDRVYNAAAVVAAGERLASYRKVHLFGFEGECFDPGDTPFSVVEHGGLKVGTMICFDWIYPESARTLAVLGADVIAHPSNLVLPGWCQRAMEIRALENRVFAVTANRFGTEDRPPRKTLTFTGASQIVGPDGTVLTSAEPEGQTRLSVQVDLSKARSKRIPSGNDVFAERRPEMYAVLTKRPDRPTS
ncbi:MAG: nitrilase-related carbon-nitrogen hydrolase [Planctomycetota bacterium]|nr:nitrilase-related carbon-nitrogen hydrolase [Planctomycetota bacterium]